MTSTDHRSRTAARDALIARAWAVASGATVLALGSTGVVVGLLSRPADAPAPANVQQPAAAAAPVTPRPRRTIYVRVPAAAPSRPQAATRRDVRPVQLRAPAQPPRRVQAPPVSSSSGS